MSILDAVLLVTAVVTVIADILLVVNLRFVLPKHITEKGYYPADGRRVSFEDAVKVCPCLSRVFPGGTSIPIAFKPVENNVAARKKREVQNVTAAQLQHYPYLVSASIPAYFDDHKQKIFACNGLIQTVDLMITSKSCVKEESEWSRLTIRSGSAYWSSLGKEHSVVGTHRISEDLVAVEVFPKFEERLVPNPPIAFPFHGDWVHAVSLGWDDNMYGKNLNSRYKHRRFEIEEWTSRSCKSNGTNVCHQSRSCRISTKPLVTSCHHLIGMKFGGGGVCDDFSDLGVNQTKGGNECYKIYKDTCHIAEMDIC